MIELLSGALIGLLAGTHIATWGMYKDAPHEGFTVPKYARAIMLGAGLGAIAAPIMNLDLTQAHGIAVFFGVVYALERAVEELYKTCLREEDQSKYFIPMQFHVMGRVVASRAVRWSVAAVYVTVGATAAWGIWLLSVSSPEMPALALVAVAGSAGGWLSAFGGAWKDAPIEGFSFPKFLRSPVIALSWALLLARMVENPVLLGLAAIGYTVATIETYKTFFFPNRPRGKFAGKPILFPEVLRFRQRFIPLYAGIWLIVLVILFIGLRTVEGGLL